MQELIQQVPSFTPAVPYHRCLSGGRWLLVMVAFGCSPLGAARAAVVVLANRAQAAVAFQLQGQQRRPRSHTLAVDRVVALPIAHGDVLELAGRDGRQFQLTPNTAYFFHDSPDQRTIELTEIGIAAVNDTNGADTGWNDAGGNGIGGRKAAVDDPAEAARSAAPRVGGGAAPVARRPKSGRAAAKPFRIPVKILVDEDHPAQRKYWETLLQRRLAMASDLFEEHGCVGFEMVAADTWQSDDAVHDFEASYQEFEREVAARPARLAIGFSYQYALPDARSDLGGQRRPLASHLLLAERGNISEIEKCELLCHELGHYLGAAHSLEPQSVMRLVLSDGRQARHRFNFDPLNTLAIGMLSERLAAGKLRSLDDLDGATRGRLVDVYTTLAQTLPQDNHAPRLAGWLRSGGQTRSADPRAERPARAATPQREEAATVASAARRVLRAVTQSASSLGAGASRLDGDKLTERYVRAAAAVASREPVALRAQALFLGLAIAIDRSDTLRGYPVLGDYVRTIEPDGERDARLTVLGKPAMRGRVDLGQHFFFSAAIFAMTGEPSAEMAGLTKELRDSRGGSGFSFSDWCADLAGIALAKRVREGGVRVDDLAETFTVPDYLPEIGGLRDNLPERDFVASFGGVSDARFKVVDADIRRRIARLYEASAPNRRQPNQQTPGAKEPAQQKPPMREPLQPQSATRGNTTKERRP